MNVHREGRLWRFKPFEDCPAFYTSNPPNRFRRWLFWLLLGVQWTREE